MVIHLRPITDRLEVVDGFNFSANRFVLLHEIIYTTSRPHVLIRSYSCDGVEREITIDLEGIPNQASTKIHYAGCHDGGMYFYTAKKKKWLFDQESPQIKFCHRQPYYLLQTRSADIWTVKHFDESKEVENKIVDLRGVSTENALLLLKNGTLFVLCNGPKQLRSRDKNVVVIQDPDVGATSTAYVESDNPIIYITHSAVPELLFLHSETLSLKRESISSWVHPAYHDVVYNRVLDIRFALRGLLIIAEVKNEGTALGVVQLEDRYWKSKQQMEEELANALRGPERAKENEKRKKLGQDLAAANSKINLLRKEVSQLKQSKTSIPNQEISKQQQQQKFGRQNLCEPQAACSSPSTDEKSSMNLSKPSPNPKNKTAKGNNQNQSQNPPKKSRSKKKNNGVQESSRDK